MDSITEQVLETSSPGYPRRLLENLSRLWQDSSFCDVTLLISRRRFHAHKNVLAASSSFFRAMFFSGMEEQNKREIELYDVSPGIFNTIISFMYTGHVRVDTDTCQDLLAAADMLGVEDVVDICSEFLLENISPQNCIGIYVFADAHNLLTMKRQAELYLHKNFLQVCKGDEFFELELDTLLPILGSELLCIEKEGQVLEAGLEWIMTVLPLRRKYLLKVLNRIRMNLISHCDLIHIIDSCDDFGIKTTLIKYVSPLNEASRILNSQVVYLPLTSTDVVAPAWPRQNAVKYIYVIGGFTRNRQTFASGINTLDSVERYDIYSKKWKNFTSMHNARSSHGIAILDRKVIVAGGEDELLISDSVETFDPNENEWTPLPSMKNPRYGLGLVALNGYLYAIGGHIGTQVGADIERYDPQEKAWLEYDTNPNPKFCMATVEYEGLIYIVGGLLEMYTETYELESYNPVTKEWCHLAKMTCARTQLGLVAHDGYLYAVGGYNNYDGSLNSVERYSIKDVSRVGAAVAVVDGKIFVFGGRLLGEEYPRSHSLNSSVTLDSAEQYDPESDTWTSLPNMSCERCEAVAAVL